MKGVKRRSRLSYRARCAALALPSLLGVAMFYVVPYGNMLYLSLLESNFSRKFVGLRNYIGVFQNKLFQLALANSFLFTVLATLLAVALALTLSLLLFSLASDRLRNVLRYAFITPMLLPTAGIVIIWRVLFADENLTQTLLQGLENGWRAVLPVLTLFIWKNTGYCLILISAAIGRLSPSVMEAAKLDGAGGFRIHRYMTIPLIRPTLFFCANLIVLYSFRIFKESYLYYETAFPPDSVYTVPYFINNHFLRLDYQRSAAAAVLFSAVVLILVLVGFRLDRSAIQDSEETG